MNLLKWDEEKMGVGYKVIDDQHKELINIINKLSTSINHNSQQRDILDIVNELINYTDYHFSTEEALFERFNYKLTDEHKQEHKDFDSKFSNIKNELLEDDFYKNKSAVEVSEEIFLYIIDWLMHHILDNDKKFVSSLKEADSK